MVYDGDSHNTNKKCVVIGKEVYLHSTIMDVWNIINII